MEFHKVVTVGIAGKLILFDGQMILINLNQKTI